MSERDPESGRSGFGERLADAVGRRRSQVVLGLDPDPMLLWPRALELAPASAKTGSAARGAARGRGALPRW